MSQKKYPVDRDVVKEIAQTLGETERKPLKQIENIIRFCGAEFAQELLKDALEIENNGGMMTSEGDRRRTLGGVFFQLARQRMPYEAREEVFMVWRAKNRRREQHEAQYPEFDWQQRAEILTGLDESGKVSEVKISLIGRPGQIERRQNLIVTTMRDEMGETLQVPSGVPHPSAVVQDYTVYISSKQWERVEKAIENPKDELIVDGYCGYDEDAGGMAVFTTYVTTRNLLRKEKKQAKKAAQEGDGKQGKKGQSARQDSNGKRRKSADANRNDGSERNDQVSQGRPAEARAAATQAEGVPEGQAAEEPEVSVPVPEGMPPQAARKFIDLHKAAETFRQKIARIESKPPDQQYGLEMAQKLLSNTEKQIAQLEKQYSSSAGSES